jgi:hypothetical protein
VIQAKNFLLSLLAPGLAMALASESSAQVRTATISRQLQAIEPHEVRIDYAAGKLDLRAGNDSVLYSMQLQYDASHVMPRHEYDALTRTLRIGTRSLSDDSNSGMRWRGGSERGSAIFEFARGVPLSLSMNTGATQGTLDVGGLSLVRLVMNTGASETRVRFSSLNPVPMQRLEMNMGAATVVISQLANANASSMTIQAAAGSVDLDFGGEWTQDIVADLELAVGALTVRVPPNVGIRVEATRVLASLEAAGLRRDGNNYTSANWEAAEHRLVLRTRTTLGKITLRRDAH